MATPLRLSFLSINARGLNQARKRRQVFRWAHNSKADIIFLQETILGDPGAASWDDGIVMGESLQQERESPWALTLTERVPEAFEIPPSDWPEKFFSGQSGKRNSRATLASSYTRLFSSSIAVVAWPVQREHF